MGRPASIQDSPVTCARATPTESGQTLVELLVVLLILLVVVGALATMFTSGLGAETDQNQRVQAQQDARLGLNQMRRDLRCASALTNNTTSLVTMSLPSYCASSTSTTLSGDITLPNTSIGVASTSGFSTGTNTLSLQGSSSLIVCTGLGTGPTRFTGCSGGASGVFLSGTTLSGAVTWCVTGSTLVRFVGSVAAGGLCPSSGGQPWVQSVISPPFTYTRMSAPTVTAAAGGSLDPGQYFYEVTPITSSGELAGTVSAAVAITSGSGNQEAHITWSPFTGATGFNVYGRDNGSTFPRMTPTPEAPQGLRLLTPTPLASTAISFDDPGPNSAGGIDTATVTAGPPLATVGVKLVIDQTPADTNRRFTLADTIALRNSGRF
jgi:type II secretory pathway pseudopilin PulG